MASVRCCSTHPDRPIEAWCTGCRVAVCMRCAAFDHRGADHGELAELGPARIEQAAALQAVVDEVSALRAAGLAELAEAFDGGVGRIVKTEADAARACRAAFAWLEAAVVAGVTKRRDATLNEIALRAAQAKTTLSTASFTASFAAADPAAAAAHSRARELLAPTTSAAALLAELPPLLEVLAGYRDRAAALATPSAAKVVELFTAQYGSARFVVVGPVAERFASSATSAAVAAFGAVTGGGVDGVLAVPAAGAAVSPPPLVPPSPASAVAAAAPAEQKAPAATQSTAAAPATGDGPVTSDSTMLRFEGIKTESDGLSAAALLASGWELVHCKPYSHAFSSGDLSACVAAAAAGSGMLLVAGRRTGADVLAVAAMAPAKVIQRETGPHVYNKAEAKAELTNGVYWYARRLAPAAPLYSLTDGQPLRSIFLFSFLGARGGGKPCRVLRSI